MPESKRGKSPIERAAELPPEAPLILGVDDEKAASTTRAGSVEVDEFEDGLRDPRPKELLRAAKNYGNRLQSEGRIVK